MKVTINEYNQIQLEEVFNTIFLKTPDGEEVGIAMRDGGFELCYGNTAYRIKDGEIEALRHISGTPIESEIPVSPFGTACNFYRSHPHLTSSECLNCGRFEHEHNKFQQ